MRDRWDISFATSGAKALELMEQDGAFDVVCSDMMMPGMTGDQLLAHVMERYPETVRLVLSGHSSPLTQSSTPEASPTKS